MEFKKLLNTSIKIFTCASDPTYLEKTIGKLFTQFFLCSPSFSIISAAHLRLHNIQAQLGNFPVAFFYLAAALHAHFYTLRLRETIARGRLFGRK